MKPSRPSDPKIDLVWDGGERSPPVPAKSPQKARENYFNRTSTAMSDLSLPVEAGASPVAQGSERSAIPAILIVTLLAVGAGALAGMNLVDQTRLAVLQTERSHSEEGIKPLYQNVGHIQAIKPVVANLADPKSVFVRIQGTVVFKENALDDAQVMISKIESDISSYIRTLTLADIEGAGGLRHLREDLNYRAQVRTDGKVNEFILETMVVQ